MALLWLGAVAPAQTEAPPDPDSGRKILESQCGLCHGEARHGRLPDREIGSIYYKREANYKPGTFFAGAAKPWRRAPRKRDSSARWRPPPGRCAGNSHLHSAPWFGV